MDLLALPSPALPAGTLVPDVSWHGRVYQRPWTFAFLFPDLPRLCHHWFRGEDFFPQHHEGKTLDMTVASGGDTYDICGSEAYSFRAEDVRPEVGTGVLHVRTRKRYEPSLSPPPGGVGPGIFNGGYVMTEVDEEYENSLGGFLILEYRNTARDRTTVWEYRGGESPGSPPNHVEVGSITLSDPVTHQTLSGFAESWQRDMAAAIDDVFDGGVPLLAYPLTQSNTGQRAAMAVGVALVRAGDVEPLPWEADEYSLDGVDLHLEFESRGNTPVVYEEGEHPIVGNAIYGRGYARYELKELIEEKIWKDRYGIYDEADGLDDPRVPWVESLFLAGAHAEGHGWIARGRFISLAGEYRVVLADPEDAEVLTVPVPAGGHADYELPMVATPEDEFATHVLRIEAPDGEGGWAVQDDAILSIRPAPGIRLVHLRKSREGYRWGHEPFAPQDPPAATPADQHFFRRKVFTKIARPA